MENGAEDVPMVVAYLARRGTVRGLIVRQTVVQASAPPLILDHRVLCAMKAICGQPTKIACTKIKRHTVVLVVN